MSTRRPPKPSPFDVTLTPEDRRTLGNDLARDVEDAFNARQRVIGQGGLIDLADWFYEQGQSEPHERPFVGAADLTSYFITENVDALRSRLMNAVFGVRPFCFVEGWGDDAKKAPFVEEFMDWQVRRSELKTELAKAVHGALLEDCYILEVSERIETRRVVEEIDVALELHEATGAPIFEDGAPKLQLDAGGEPVPPPHDGHPSARVKRTYTKTKRLGPQYDPISMRDFVFLPGHAKTKKQLWGYAYRFWARLPELEERVEDGLYDADAVKQLGSQSDRNDTMLANTTPPPSDVAPQYDGAVEKELFQVSLKRDLDGDGREEWYVATISLKTRELLRLKIDQFAQRIGRPRCVPIVLFPRRDSVYGYSYSFDKLLTLTEEHTAVRNMRADRSALATNKPIKQISGGLWDPEAEPFGVGAVMTVRDMNEVQEFQIADVPVSVTQTEGMLHQAKERLGGLSDSAVGVLSTERRTLGENKLVAGGSAVRVKEVIGHLHLAIAEIMYLSHAIWVETLQADPRGLDAPPSVASALASKGITDFKGKFTGPQLSGDFAFEPYGSDEQADPQQRRQDFDGGFVALANLAKVFPQLAAVFQSQDAAKAVLEQWMRVYDVRDRQPFLGAFNTPPPAPAAAGPGPQVPVAPGGLPAAPGPGGAPGGLPDLPALIARLHAASSGAGGAGGPMPTGGAPVGR